jgi:hypothetical protein
MESQEGAWRPGAEMTPAEAASAVYVIGLSRAWLADRIVAPGWFHLAFGALAGGVIAEAEIRSWALFGWSVAAYTLGCGALMWWNQRRVGVAMEYFDCRTRAVFAGHVLALSGLIATACWLGLDRGTHGAFLVAGALAVPLAVVSGRWTDKLLRARLRANW